MKKLVSSFLFLLGTSLALSAFAMDKPLRAEHESLECISCHGVETPKAPFVKTSCADCHDAVELAETTKDSLPVNPHTSPHWGTDAACSACHKEHAKNVYMCNDCHTFDTSSMASFFE